MAAPGFASTAVLRIYPRMTCKRFEATSTSELEIGFGKPACVRSYGVYTTVPFVFTL